MCDVIKPWETGNILVGHDDRYISHLDRNVTVANVVENCCNAYRQQYVHDCSQPIVPNVSMHVKEGPDREIHRLPQETGMASLVHEVSAILMEQQQNCSVVNLLRRFRLAIHPRDIRNLLGKCSL